MEKLIELLNEFINKTIFPYDRGAKCIWYENHLFLFETWTDVLEDTIISKRYWFIKWLVENDKIDTDPIRTRIKRVYVELEPREFTPQDFVDRVIMLLSISDTPIEDLILYLK